jgi:hypothetical protein
MIEPTPDDLVTAALRALDGLTERRLSAASIVVRPDSLSLEGLSPLEPIDPDRVPPQRARLPRP